MGSADDIRLILRGHIPFDEAESRSLKSALNLLDININPFSRSSFNPGHVTVSAFVVNAQQEVALIYNSKLNRWLQPGGHVEELDSSLAAACAREVFEETGLSCTISDLKFFDIDAHFIPPRKGDPEHQHFDFRFLFLSPQNKLIAGSDAQDATWVPLTELVLSNDEGLRRMAKKVLGEG